MKAHTISNKYIKYYYITFILAMCWSGNIYAQSLPSSADTSKLEHKVDVGNIFDNKDLGIKLEISADTPIPDAIDGFILNGIVINGLTAFDLSDFDELINEYINQEVDLNVLNHLASRITKHYKTNSYFLTKAFIPSQDIKNNIVRIEVIETYVNNITIDDPERILDRDLTNITKSIIIMIENLKPLHGETLERYMLLLNRGSGVSVQSILSPVKDNMGAIDITLKVEKKLAAYSIGYNNHGSRYIGPHQIEASYIEGNFLSPRDSLSFKTILSLPINELGGV